MNAWHVVLSGRSLQLAVGVLVLSACGSPPVSQAPESSAKPATEGAKEVTLTEAVAMCQAVQQSHEIPVLCSAKYIKDVPTMAVAFRSEEEAVKLVPIIEAQILSPFCDAAVAGNRRAQVVEMIGDQAERRLECEMRQWSDWHSLASPLDKGLKLCSEIQNSRQLPMRCTTDVVQGVPILVFAFQNQQAAAEYQDAASQQIAVPFCESANAAHLDAAVFQSVGKKMRGLACSDGKWSSWGDVKPSGSGPKPQKSDAVSVVKTGIWQ